MSRAQNAFFRIVERQLSFQWGDEYQPSIRASRSEGPRISRLRELNWKRYGRTLHLLSTPEIRAVNLALYNPNVFDIHEQKMLHPTPTTHPLFGHPLAQTMILASHKGTLDVAERLGSFRSHPTVWIDNGEQRERIPFPYLGDLLLYLKSFNGNPYCVNWTVKNTESDFSEHRRGKIKTLAQQHHDIEKAKIRHEIERIYYLDAGIRTQQIVKNSIDDEVSANLELCMTAEDRLITLSPVIINDFTQSLTQAIGTSATAAEIINTYAKYHEKAHEFRMLFYRAVWRRELLLDLFQPVLIDRPMVPQNKDVLDVYSNYFAGLSQC
ncbi:transposase [Pseudomonas putida]|uniref:transposase n=1 Tax=Pseudomonas putida TaxID=303 RepID=UPI000B150B56|nr:transposase [Pseudomonas putida]